MAAAILDAGRRRLRRLRCGALAPRCSCYAAVPAIPANRRCCYYWNPIKILTFNKAELQKKIFSAACFLDPPSVRRPSASLMLAEGGTQNREHLVCSPFLLLEVALSLTKTQKDRNFPNIGRRFRYGADPLTTPPQYNCPLVPSIRGSLENVPFRNWWIFINDLPAPSEIIIWFLLFDPLMCSINRFTNIKTALHSLGKPYLVVVNYSFNILLNSICWHFV